MVLNNIKAAPDDEDLEDDNGDNDLSYNTTHKERMLSAASALAYRLKQEKKLKEKLKSHFKDVSKTVKKSYANNGKLPSFDFHKKQTKKIINDHYVEVATTASKTIRTDFQPLTDDDEDVVTSLLDDKISDDADDRSEFAADSIANTTQDNYKTYLKDAIASAAAVGYMASRDDIADDITEDFDGSVDGRLDLISQMETDTAYTDGRMDELEVLNDVDAEFEDGSNASDYKQQKTWTAILDDRTRPAHAEADGQQVEIDEPFEVDGEQLNEPRDDSLGASDENIMGCRCDVEISLE